MGFYDTHILPHLLDWAMDTKPIRYQRRKVVPLAEGKVLEIGIGAGHNLPFYDAGKVTKVWGLEPSPEMRMRALKAAARTDLDVELIDFDAEEIPLDDRSVDTVLVTYTLCTIPDAIKALYGMGRVLKPGGKLIFCEHGEAPDASVRKWQHRLTPVWKKIGGGCYPGRPIPAMLREGGFAIDRLDTMYLPGTPRFAGFNYWGIARKA